MAGIGVVPREIVASRPCMGRGFFVYLILWVGDESVSLHAEGEKVVMTKDDGTREEVDLSAPGPRAQRGEGRAQLPRQPVEVPAARSFNRIIKYFFFLICKIRNSIPDVDNY